MQSAAAERPADGRTGAETAAGTMMVEHKIKAAVRIYLADETDLRRDRSQKWAGDRRDGKTPRRRYGPWGVMPLCRYCG
ncbi:hypothetical protein JCM4914_38750 [Streptomyces platensis subsp. malvinus]